MDEYFIGGLFLGVIVGASVSLAACYTFLFKRTVAKEPKPQDQTIGMQPNREDEDSLESFFKYKDNAYVRYGHGCVVKLVKGIGPPVWDSDLEKKVTKPGNSIPPAEAHMLAQGRVIEPGSHPYDCCFGAPIKQNKDRSLFMWLFQEVRHDSEGANHQRLSVYTDRNGDLVVSGEEWGPAIEEMTGRDDYEYMYTIPAKHKDNLLFVMIYGMFGGSGAGFSGIQAIADANNIPTESMYFHRNG